MLAVGLFGARDDLENFSANDGLFHGGGLYLLGVQALACVTFMCWSSLCTFVLISVINKIIPFRMDEYEELLGADYAEHNIHHPGVGVTRAVSVMRRHDSHHDLGLIPVGKNKGINAVWSALVTFLITIFNINFCACLARPHGLPGERVRKAPRVGGHQRSAEKGRFQWRSSECRGCGGT